MMQKTNPCVLIEGEAEEEEEEEEMTKPPNNERSIIRH